MAPEEIGEVKSRLTGDLVTCSVVVTEAKADACITVSVQLPPGVEPEVVESLRAAAAKAAREIAEELGAG
jgi:hypothetical protein